MAVTALVAAIAAAFVFDGQVHLKSPRTDFSYAWFGARILLRGQNPYVMVGPGLAFDSSFRLNHPATAMVAAIPFSLLPEGVASIGFAGACSAMVALLAATNYLPGLGWATAAKPNLGIPLALATTSRVEPN